MTETRHFTTGDDCRIAYRLDGDPQNPPLVFANSIATTYDMWDAQIEEFARNFHVVRYDMRGHGRSDVPPGAYSVDRLGNDVLELLDHLQIGRAHFCGLSLGGFVGQWLGVHAPGCIDRLVLSNTSPYLGPAPQWDDLIRKTRDPGSMTFFADMFIGNWFSQVTLRDNPETSDPFRQMVTATDPQGLAGSFAAVRDADTRRTVSLITAPTLVIGGSDDTVTVASHSEDIAGKIPNSKLVILDGVHLLNAERPNDFDNVVLKFLKSA
ncbi:alpha/beta fold hydrolase [Puniceibacterium sp. IMCC21224]|jgi:3-oxoadipate enol-lactonase|uniref:alpha/beta fold hydrolase n=1 Tax=Puniceibacterium sp. IMCC21224 TaxID=1618204 RepID=UPI00064DD90E|nr:alpha/beta fold hydrolase [Puniceibacterium sp. IMCC21224]KMK64650.1 putative hydrolase or acyltransferase of alpha/beta superfamily [Puniceibacterium sp. IMCC21224]